MSRTLVRICGCFLVTHGTGSLFQDFWRRIGRPDPRHEACTQHLGRAGDATPLLEDAFAIGGPLARRLAASRVLGAEYVRFVFKVERDELDVLIERGGDERADRRYRRSVEARVLHSEGQCVRGRPRLHHYPHTPLSP